ncbi:uncharacterized protein F4822DRAFT_293360 [Hypoxylon trugodes]|uniref:uncharacterized protein n=1 Tax=Hypoxylon trugodes TaxID=326681 RepID=UPI002191697A|nr:uncharacterized protein F4822DRAFT_293360 [Hypoxylon trugodes]KAI1387828.1 hypothetical protein F4822DRAFT_293360 [Hypoxylon trugodes]
MPPRKRTAAEAVSTPESGGRRRSGRISAGATRSTYFEGVEEEDGVESKRPRKAVKVQAKANSKVKRGKAKKEESIDELQQYEDEDEEEEEERVARGLSDDGENDAFDGDKYEEEEEEEEEEEDGGSEALPSSPSPPPSAKRGRGRPKKSESVNTTPITKKVDAKAKTPGTAKGLAKTQANAKTKAKAKDESEDPDVEEDDDDDDDDEEDRITFIPAVKMRETGGVAYEDTKIHKNTLLFLGDLKKNNKRSWLKANDAEYRRALKDWESFVETITEKIVEVDDTIPELPIKDVIFRIYRDIRFSKDPTPYKPHFSAAWSRTGRKGPYACYYIHIEPNGCMVGGGLWHPDNTALARMRASFDERPHRIRRILTNPMFAKTFLPAAKSGGEKAVLKAFVAKNQGNALKTKPKGFHPDHRDIELLKLRNYTVGTKIDDADLLAEDAQDRIMEIISAMVDFVSYINSVVMPDPNVDDDSSDENGEDAGEENGEQEEEDGESDGI